MGAYRHDWRIVLQNRHEYVTCSKCGAVKTREDTSECPVRIGNALTDRPRGRRLRERLRTREAA